MAEGERTLLRDPAVQSTVVVGGGIPDDNTLAGTTAPDPNFGLCEGAPRFGRYRVVGEIARGGMGVVYRAVDPDFERVVAIKVLGDSLKGSPISVSRFLDEARITGQLQHPAIPPVHEIGEVGGAPYLVMKLIGGATLQEELSKRVAPGADLAKWLAVFESICQGMAYAHSRGVIHRDLKPLNVMVGAFGEVQIMDWGLAKPLSAHSGERPDGPAVGSIREEEGDFTQYGQAMGTPAYIAPEQARGESDAVDRRADVFGLGAILCVVLTGKAPFRGENQFEIINKARRGEVEDAFARLDACGAPEEFVGLAKRCLAPAPDGRPADAGVLAADLVALRVGREERQRKAELDWHRAEVFAVEQKRRRGFRNKAYLAGAVAAVLAAAGVAWFFLDRADRRVAAAQKESEDTREKTRLLDEKRKAESRVPIDSATEAIRSLYRQLDRGQIEEAENSLRTAEALLATVENDEMAAKLRDAKADCALAVRIDEIQTAFDSGIDDPARFAELYAVPKREEYRKFFREAGYDLERGPAANAARMRQSRVLPSLLSALDHWASFEGDPELRETVWAHTEAISGESWRGQLRPDLKLKSTGAVPSGTAADEPRPPAYYFLKGVALERAYQDYSRSRKTGDPPQFGAPASGWTVFSEGYLQHPSSFWLHFQTALVFYRYRAADPKGALSLQEFGRCRTLRPDCYNLLRHLQREYARQPATYVQQQELKKLEAQLAPLQQKRKRSE